MRIFTLLLLTLTLCTCADRPDGEAIADRQMDDEMSEGLRGDEEVPSIEEVNDGDVPTGMTEQTGEEGDVLNDVTIHPIYHGSVALEYAGQTVFVDPHGGAERFTEFGAPDVVLITHTHGDHMDKSTLGGLTLAEATLVAPGVVVEELGDFDFATTVTLANGESDSFNGIGVEAIPAYNLPKAADAFHPPGKFNGYVVTFGDQRIYFSGDTEDIEEMRALESIDVAFVCMNQPYTMTVAQAADAVADFQPTTVYPYHYRNQDGSKSDLADFVATLADTAPAVEVRIRNWYTEAEGK